MNIDTFAIQTRLKKQFPINITANFAYFVLTVGIGIWLVPYLIKHVGVAAYGLVPLAISITEYMSLLTVSINGAVSRYLTIDLQKKDTATANQTFNTAFLGSLGIVILILPFGGLFSYYVPDILEVPAGQENNARLLFFAITTIFLVRTMAANFSVSSFALNRLDLRNGVEGCRQILRVIFVVLFFNLFSSQVYFVGISYLFGALISLLLTVWIWKKLTPELNVHFGSFTRSRLRDLLGMGGWMFASHVAMLLFLHIDLIVVNKMFGAESGGKYASVLQWSFLLRTMSITFAGVLTPTILTYYAHKQIDQVLKVSKKAVKFLGMMMALPIGLVCGFASPLLSIWIAPEFSKLAPLMWLMVGHLCINLSILPLFSIQIALNKVRVPGIVSLSMGMCNISLAILLPLLLGWGMYGVAAAGAIVLTLKNAIFTPLYGARILGKRWHTFIISMLPGVIASMIIAMCSFLIANRVNPSGWFELVACFGIISLIYVLISFFIVLRHDERNLLLSFLPFSGPSEN